MKKKILITRKLLRQNEERASKIWDVKLNLNDEIAVFPPVSGG